MVEYSLFCDPHFEVNAYAKRKEESRVVLPRLSVIEYKSITLNCICIGQIIAIIEFKGITQCIVSRLIEEGDQSTHRKLPYPLFKYSMEIDDRTRFAFEHVPIEDVLCPCFSIPAIDHANMKLGDPGLHHIKKANISYFYVLTPHRTGLVEGIEFVEYLKYNDVKNPWDKKVGNENCLTFNYYLSEEEMFLIRDVLNA